MDMEKRTPVIAQTLIFNGKTMKDDRKQLDDDKTKRDYSIAHKSTRCRLRDDDPVAEEEKQRARDYIEGWLRKYLKSGNKRKMMMIGKEEVTDEEVTDEEIGMRPHVKNILRELTGRRTAIIKSLTSDFKEFYDKCDPGIGRRIGLYGNVDGSWEIKDDGYEEHLCYGHSPPPLSFGINLIRDSMSKLSWKAKVARLSDAWLASVAMHATFTHGLNGQQRIEIMEALASQLPISRMSQVLTDDEDDDDDDDDDGHDCV